MRAAVQADCGDAEVTARAEAMTIRMWLSALAGRSMGPRTFRLKAEATMIGIWPSDAKGLET
jgi:hypothetical protein